MNESIVAKRWENPEERRKKYHYLRRLGVDSYQADKMKDWPWYMIDSWIRKHSQLGNPEVHQYKHRKPKVAVQAPAPAPQLRLQPSGIASVGEGGSPRVADTEGAYNKATPQLPEVGAVA
jgi:hypothetical protein